MTVYLDTSVVLSRLLGQSNALESWGDWERVYTSVLTRVEFLRVIDRLRLEGEIGDSERVALHRQFGLLWEVCHRIPLTPHILNRAAEPFPTVLGTLDALHLASALALGPDLEEPLVFLTHDQQLARAAESLGLQVEGTTP
ncbi:type II toxin-antitoxin system VapC family toxin [Candidatus Latescibacterota bacterium]